MMAWSFFRFAESPLERSSRESSSELVNFRQIALAHAGDGVRLAGIADVGDHAIHNPREVFSRIAKPGAFAVRDGGHDDFS